MLATQGKVMRTWGVLEDHSCAAQGMMLPTRQAPIPFQNHLGLQRTQRSGSALSPTSGPVDQPSWCLEESPLLCWDADLGRPLCGWTFSQGFCLSLSGHMLESICRFPAGRNTAWFCALGCGAFLWLDYRDSVGCAIRTCIQSFDM